MYIRRDSETHDTEMMASDMFTINRANRQLLGAIQYVD